MKLNQKAFGLACGVLWGCAVFLMTLWVYYAGTGSHLYLLSKFYLGYSITPLGAFVGMAWGFVDAFVGGWILAWLYNRFAGRAAEA